MKRLLLGARKETGTDGVAATVHGLDAGDRVGVLLYRIRAHDGERSELFLAGSERDVLEWTNGLRALILERMRRRRGKHEY